jgi:hypothetical protein
MEVPTFHVPDHLVPSHLVPTLLEGQFPERPAGIVREYLNPEVDCPLCQEAGCVNVAMGFGDTGFRCRGHASPNTIKKGICFKITAVDGYHVGVKDAVKTLFDVVWRMYSNPDMYNHNSVRYHELAESREGALANLRGLPMDM